MGGLPIVLAPTRHKWHIRHMTTTTNTATVSPVTLTGRDGRTLVLEPASFVSAYIGKVDRCCCGCSGTHYRPTEGEEAQKAIARIVRTIAAAWMGGAAEVGEVGDDEKLDWASDGQYVSAVVGRKLYIAYTR